MENGSLVDVLERQWLEDSRLPTSCASVPALFAMARGSRGGTADLARHILGCARCARFWAEIQADRGVTLGELVGLRLWGHARTPQIDFARLRIEDHVSRCETCARVALVANRITQVAGALGRSVHFQNLGSALRRLELAPVMREASTYALEAVVLDASGTPSVKAGAAERRAVELLRATLDDEGRLRIELAAPVGCAGVLIAVSAGDQLVMLPEAPVEKGRARIVVETQARGAAASVPVERLTIWVRMSDSGGESE